MRLIVANWMPPAAASRNPPAVASRNPPAAANRNPPAAASRNPPAFVHWTAWQQPDWLHLVWASHPDCVRAQKPKRETRCFAQIGSCRHAPFFQQWDWNDLVGWLRQRLMVAGFGRICFVWG